MTHIITETYDTLLGGTPLSRIPKPLVMGKRFDPIYISELVNIRFTYACFHKGNEECHYDAETIWVKLEGNHIEVLKHSLDKTMKG